MEAKYKTDDTFDYTFTDRYHLKHTREGHILDVLTTENSAGETVRIEYVFEYMYEGNNKIATVEQ
ncbi:MAG: hypothetical protein V3R78_10040 [Thermodesulfobacteriota bacterium]